MFSQMRDNVETLKCDNIYMGWLKSFICEVFGNVFPAFDNSFDILKLIKPPLATKSDYKKLMGKLSVAPSC